MAPTSINRTQPPIAWRLIAVGVWSILSLSFLSLFLLDLALDYQQLQAACQGAECNYLAVSSAEFVALEGIGWSTQTYALIMTLMPTITVVIFWILAGLIFWRHPDFYTGLGVSLTVLVMPITMIADTDNVVSNYPDLNLPVIIISGIGTALLLMFLYLLPNGKFYPRWAAIPMFISIVIIELLNWFVFTDPGNGSETATTALFSLFIALIALPFVFQLLRYLRFSTPTERLQTRWLLFGFFVFILSVPIFAIFFGGFVDFSPGQPRLLASIAGWFLTLAASLALPVTVAIAILRYRLWNVDLIIRKTLVYVFLTAALFVIYFGFIVLLQSLFGGLLGDRDNALATVISTLAVAAMFNPMRRRIQELIDRRFYRQKYDKVKVLASFNSGLRDEVDLDRLGDAIAGVVNQTMQPTSVSLWLRTPTDQFQRRRDEFRG